MKHVIFILFATAVWPASAATWTVCKLGNSCDYTTINAAVQDTARVHCGDTVQIKAGQGDGNDSNGTPNGWYCGGAGRCNANNPVLLTQACPANNRMTITTDQVSKLPPSNVRITPAYADGAAPVVPTIYNPGAGVVFLTQAGNGGSPASGYNITGIQFCCFSKFSDFVSPGGQRGNGTLETRLSVLSDIPSNITLNQILIRTDPAQNTRKCLDYDAFALDVLNSWIECGFDENSSDSEAINGLMGNGTILNNYISGSTETVSTGGAMPPVLTPIQNGVKADNWTVTSTIIPGPIDLAWNEITKPRWIYAEGVNWTPLMLYAKGQMIRSAAGTNTPVLKAQNTCTTGVFEPVWPGPVGGTVNDGSCTWKRTDVIDQAKNLFECKTCQGVHIHDNFFHRVWPQGQQGYTFTLTSSQTYTTQQRVNQTTIENNYIHDVGTFLNSSGMDPLQDLNGIPSIMTGEGPWNITGTNDKLSFTVDGTSTVLVTLTNGIAQTATNVQADLTAAFTTAGVGLACLDNLGALVIRGRALGDSSSTCNSSAINHLTSPHSLVVNSTANDAWPTLVATLGPAPVEGVAYAGCQNPRTLIWYACGQLNDLRVHNNLATNVNTGKFYTGVAYIFDVAQHEKDVQYTHNTISGVWGIDPGTLGTSLNTGWFTGLDLKWFPFNVLIRDNVIGWTGNPSITRNYVNAQGLIADFSAINYIYGQPVFENSSNSTPVDSIAPAGIFSRNILPLSTLFSATTRNTVPANLNLGFNSYPSDNYNIVPAFNKTWGLTNPPGPATDLTALGADPSTIPRILNAKIQTSDRAAVLQYQVTEPVAKSGYGCIAYVTGKDSYFYTQPTVYDRADSAPVVADMDPSLFTQPDWDGNDKFPQSGSLRSIIIGLNQPLSPSTTYYLRLLCPGASWPEDDWISATFTTLPAESGTRSISLRRTPSADIGVIASMRVTYGTSYSRSSGIISGGAIASASCSAGSPCVVQVPAASGAPLYTQVQYLDVNNTALFSEPVPAPMLP